MHVKQFVRLIANMLPILMNYFFWYIYGYAVFD